MEYTCPAASNWTQSQRQELKLATGIHSYELNIVETSHPINFISGFRYLEVRDQAHIIAHPQSLFRAIGASASFSVTALGDLPISYQWRLNGVNLCTIDDITLHYDAATGQASYTTD